MHFFLKQIWLSKWFNLFTLHLKGPCQYIATVSIRYWIISGAIWEFTQFMLHFIPKCAFALLMSDGLNVSLISPLRNITGSASSALQCYLSCTGSVKSTASLDGFLPAPPALVSNLSSSNDPIASLPQRLHFSLWGFTFAHESFWLGTSPSQLINSLWYQRDFISTKKLNVCSLLPFACENPEINLV